MDTPRVYSSDGAFTPAVKAIQGRKGSRRGYHRRQEHGSWKTQITSELAEFIARHRSIFVATANPEGKPYIQHRGVPPGFLRVIDISTVGFVDFVGNRQYITQGNLREDPKAGALQGAPRTGHYLYSVCLGCQLSAAHSASL